MNALLRRRSLGSFLLATAGAVIVRPRFGLGATDDPPSPLRTVGVHNAKQFDKALADAQPGDHIVLANGTYDGDRTLSRGGIAQAPVVILAASKHKATLTGTLTFAGAHTIAYRLQFAGNSLGCSSPPMTLRSCAAGSSAPAAPGPRAKSGCGSATTNSAADR